MLHKRFALQYVLFQYVLSWINRLFKNIVKINNNLPIKSKKKKNHTGYRINRLKWVIILLFRQIVLVQENRIELGSLRSKNYYSKPIMNAVAVGSEASRSSKDIFINTWLLFDKRINAAIKLEFKWGTKKCKNYKGRKQIASNADRRAERKGPLRTPWAKWMQMVNRF